MKLAIQRMMPKNKIGRHMLSKLKLYAGTTHPHQAQNPVALEALSGRPAIAGAIYAPKPVVKEKVQPAKPTPARPEPAAMAHEEPVAAPPTAETAPPAAETPAPPPTEA